ncbi:MAG: acyl-CoA dehydrogenase family protein, partial [Pseudomonadota bacterium]|nr:acyl-CoA dehydrogenase family protein [Pseudomonadota bacterium]
MNEFDTHEVFNQAPPFADVNLFACDSALREGLEREGAGWAEAALRELGGVLGSAGILDLGRQANANPPKLVNFDRTGRRIDEVEFHPSWHQLMALMIGAGVHAAPWDSGQPGAQVARAAQFLLFGQVENGAQCPVTMTYASVPALRQAGAFAASWLPKILSRDYDPRSLPIGQKRGALIGMGMTEKQGGTDVRANTTQATRGEGDAWRIVGHKWFFSAPQSDAHLILAQAEDEGLSCFFVPRFLPDGSRNAIRVQRLKDKLGNRSNASSEVEFAGATGWLVGPIGRGIPTILEMGSHTRLDCVIGSAGIMRAALTHALH